MTALVLLSLGVLILVHVLERIRRRPLQMSTAWLTHHEETHGDD